MVAVHTLLAIIVMFGASEPLTKAIECYEELDYPCAESNLAQALETPLSAAERLKALYYQALIAIAWRDEAPA